MSPYQLSPARSPPIKILRTLPVRFRLSTPLCCSPGTRALRGPRALCRLEGGGQVNPPPRPAGLCRRHLVSHPHPCRRPGRWQAINPARTSPLQLPLDNQVAAYSMTTSCLPRLRRAAMRSQPAPRGLVPLAQLCLCLCLRYSLASYDSATGCLRLCHWLPISATGRLPPSLSACLWLAVSTAR